MAILVGFALVAMVGIVGLALDLGQLYVAKAELQNAADACALAAAQSLDGASGRQLAVAEAAGMTTGARHSIGFHARPVRLTAGESVQFAQASQGPWFTAQDFTANDPAARGLRYARCSVSESDIRTWFIQVLNVLPGVAIGAQQVSARAVATLTPSQTTCALPVAMCSDKLSVATPTGTWLRGISSPGETGSSDFRWVNLTADGRGTRDLAELLTGDGACELPTAGTRIGVTGARTGLASEWNTRFGIYQGGQYSAQSAPPDQSGFAYTEASWPAVQGTRANAFSHFVAQRAANVPYQGDAGTGLNTVGNALSSRDLAEYGRLRRVAPVPVVDCSGFDGSGKQAPLQWWACIFMLHPLSTGGGRGNQPMWLEYLGDASRADSPCVSTGLPGGPDSVGPRVPVLTR